MRHAWACGLGPWGLGRVVPLFVSSWCLRPSVVLRWPRSTDTLQVPALPEPSLLPSSSRAAEAGDQCCHGVPATESIPASRRAKAIQTCGNRLELQGTMPQISLRDGPPPSRKSGRRTLGELFPVFRQLTETAGNAPKRRRLSKPLPGSSRLNQPTVSGIVWALKIFVPCTGSFGAENRDECRAGRYWYCSGSGWYLCCSGQSKERRLMILDPCR